MSEITNQDQLASNQEPNTEENKAAESQAPEPLQVPKKFVGKSSEEILRAYNDLEKQFHKVSSERVEERKSRETLENRMRDIETRVSAQPQAAAVQHQPVQEESDPLEEYDKLFDSDPKEAIKRTIKRTSDKATETIRRANLEREYQEASNFHTQKKTSDPDYARLEPQMQQLAQEFGDLVRPDRASSVKALKLLHLAARGASVDSYVSEAVSKAKKEGISVREEKRNAVSESTRASGEADKVNFADLPLEDMAKILGRADK